MLKENSTQISQIEKINADFLFHFGIHGPVSTRGIYLRDESSSTLTKVHNQYGSFITSGDMTGVEWDSGDKKVISKDELLVCNSGGSKPGIRYFEFSSRSGGKKHSNFFNDLFCIMFSVFAGSNTVNFKKSPVKMTFVCKVPVFYYLFNWSIFSYKLMRCTAYSIGKCKIRKTHTH